MALFETLIPLPPAAVDAGADALQTRGGFLIRIDPRGVCLYVTACPNYEVDFKAGTLVGELFFPTAMTQEEYDRLSTWARGVIPQICARWKQRHPEN